MGFLKKGGALGVAKKVVTEARKPHNQAKIKSGIAKVKARRGQSRPR